MTAESQEKRQPRLEEKEEGLYDWQPGNGCRYYIAVTQTGRGKLVTWLRHQDIGGPSFLVIDVAEEAIGAGYFMEKMRIEERHTDDATAVLDFMVHMGITKRYY